MNRIQEIIDQVQHLPENQLYAGLTLLANSAKNYNGNIDRDDGEIFRILSGELEWQRKATWSWSPLWNPGNTNKALEDSMHDFIYEGANTDINLLLDPSIEHEWLMGPGKELFERFKTKFKVVICKGPDSPYMKMERGLIGQDDLPATIVASLLAAGISVSTFWIPILVYFSLLLVKTGLKMYCEV